MVPYKTDNDSNENECIYFCYVWSKITKRIIKLTDTYCIL